MTPKAPPFKIREDAPTLLNDVLRYFLPMGLSIEQKESERQSLFRFISELNQIRRQNTERDFAHSYVVNNVSVLAESYPFVSIINYIIIYHFAQSDIHFFLSMVHIFQGMSTISVKLDGFVTNQLDRTNCSAQSKIFKKFTRFVIVTFESCYSQFSLITVCIRNSSTWPTNTISLHKSYGNGLCNIIYFYKELFTQKRYLRAIFYDQSLYKS